MDDEPTKHGFATPMCAGGARNDCPNALKGWWKLVRSPSKPGSLYRKHSCDE